MNKEIESIINYYINNDVARDKVRDYIEELHNNIDKAYKYIKNKQVIDLDYLEKILKDSDVDV